jgi:hypothetical protein
MRKLYVVCCTQHHALPIGGGVVNVCDRGGGGVYQVTIAEVCERWTAGVCLFVFVFSILSSRDACLAAQP